MSPYQPANRTEDTSAMAVTGLYHMRQQQTGPQKASPPVMQAWQRVALLRQPEGLPALKSAAAMVQAWLWADLDRLVAEDSPKHNLCLSIADDLGLHAGHSRLIKRVHMWFAAPGTS